MFKKFNSNLEVLEKNIKNLIIENEKRVEELLKRGATYKNFVTPYQEMEEKLEDEFTQLSHLNSVKNSEATQNIYNRTLPLIVNYNSKLSQDERIFKVFKNIKEREFETLNSEQKRVVENKLIDFRLSGIGLDENRKKRIEEINLKLSQLSTDFSQNVLNATNSYQLIIEDKKDIEGLPQNDIEIAKFYDNGVEKYRFTLQLPSYISYMTYGRNRNLREKLYKAYVTRASENEKIIDEILALRDEEAKILGFKNYAELSIETKMANSTDEVINFLEELLKKSKDKAKKELKELEKLAKREGVERLESYDISYFSEKLRREKYDIDEEEYRPYFEKNSVIEGLFQFLNRLFDVKFKKIELELWDRDAVAYDIYEKDKIIARLYLDLESREDKKGGAWMQNWETHSKIESREVLPSAFVVCNFPKSTENTPSLLRHNDVVTLFHEMGHTIHHLFSKVNEPFVSGIAGVEWDGVEFPSQFLENFAYEGEVLKIFAKHYQTEEVISDEMIKKLKRAKNFQSAMMMLRQLEFALFDFKLHLKKYQGKEIQELLDEIRREIDLITPPKYNKFQNSFSHIFAGGYSAGYYSYKWAEVLSADAFLYLLENGIFNKTISLKYKKSILEKGGSQSMKRLFKDFIGRDYRIDALLKLTIEN